MRLRYTGRGCPHPIFREGDLSISIGEAVDVTEKMGQRLLDQFGPAFERLGETATTTLATPSPARPFFPPRRKLRTKIETSNGGD